MEKEIIRYKVPFSDDREYLNETTLDAIAKHFYNPGQQYSDNKEIESALYKFADDEYNKHASCDGYGQLSVIITQNFIN